MPSACSLYFSGRQDCVRVGGGVKLQVFFCRLSEAKLLSWNVASPEFLSKGKPDAISCVTAQSWPGLWVSCLLDTEWEQVKGLQAGICHLVQNSVKKEIHPTSCTCMMGVGMLVTPRLFSSPGCKSIKCLTEKLLCVFPRC